MFAHNPAAIAASNILVMRSISSTPQLELFLPRNRSGSLAMPAAMRRSARLCVGPIEQAVDIHLGGGEHVIAIVAVDHLRTVAGHQGIK